MKVSLLCCRSVHTIVCLTAAIIMLTLQIKVKKLKLNCHDLLCHVGFLGIDVLKGNIMARSSMQKKKILLVMKELLEKQMRIIRCRCRI